MKKILIICAIALAAITVFLYAPHTKRNSQKNVSVYTLAVLSENVMIKTQQDNEFKNVTGELDIEAGTKIKTSSTGTAKLLYPNGTLVTIAPDTTLNIEVLEDGGAKSRIELITGGIWSRIKNILGPGEFYEVETENTVASVRGTIFAQKFRNGITYVYGVENDVEVQVKDPKLKKTIEGVSTKISSNEKIIINSAALPSTVQKLMPRALDVSDFRSDFIKKQSLYHIKKEDLSNEQVYKFVRSMHEHNKTDKQFIQRLIENKLIDDETPTPSVTPDETVNVSPQPTSSPTPLPTPRPSPTSTDNTVSPTPMEKPLLESVVPKSASRGSEITINGRNFTYGRNISQIKKTLIGKKDVQFYVLDSLTIFATIDWELTPGVHDVSIHDIHGGVYNIPGALTVY